MNVAEPELPGCKLWNGDQSSDHSKTVDGGEDFLKHELLRRQCCIHELKEIIHELRLEVNFHLGLHLIQYLSNSTKMATNTETAMLSINYYEPENLMLG